MSHPQTPETRERIRHGLHRYHIRKRQQAKVKPRDLARLERTGVVTPALRPLIKIATEEAVDLSDALGGQDKITPQQRILIEDLCATGIALRAMQSLFLQGCGDPDLASKIGTLAGARRASLTTLGLERISKKLDLSAYLERKAAENHSQDAIDINPDTFARRREFMRSAWHRGQHERSELGGQGRGGRCLTPRDCSCAHSQPRWCSSQPRAARRYARPLRRLRLLTKTSGGSMSATT